MKLTLTLVVASTLISQLLAQTPTGAPQAAAKLSPGQAAEAHCAKGLAAEQVGDPVAAKLAYEAALQANPKHANARYDEFAIVVSPTSAPAQPAAER